MTFNGWPFKGILFMVKELSVTKPLSKRTVPSLVVTFKPNDCQRPLGQEKVTVEEFMGTAGSGLIELNKGTKKLSA